MIDLYCHLLDETTCGPKTFEKSLETCRLALSDGVHTIVATPRWEAHNPEPPLAFETCAEKLERLRRVTNNALTLKLGFLMMFRPDLAEMLERYGEQITLGGGRYVLVSLPSLQIPAETQEVWKAINGKKYAVLVARPECNPALRSNPASLERWVANGTKLQIDAASINGAYGREVQAFAIQCIRKYRGSVVVASNSFKGRNVSLGAVYGQLGKKIGRSYARQLLKEIPAMILTSKSNGTSGSWSLPQLPTLRSRFRALSLQKITSSGS